MPVIEVDGLVKRYGELTAVDEVSFAVQRGEIFGILGRNGAGKTTTVECLEGLRCPDAGVVRVLGLEPWRQRRALSRRLGVQLQEAKLPEKLRPREALQLERALYGDGADPDELLHHLRLVEAADTPYGDLSGGQQQRLAVALALVGRPEVAILDEVTAGLDPEARREAWGLIERIRAEGVTIVLVTHAMDEAERLCDRIAVLDRGRRIALDSPAGLIGAVPRHVRLRFRPSRPLEPALLAALDEVDEVRPGTADVTVTGGQGVVHAVCARLAAEDVEPHDLVVDRPSLEDAFLALTARADEHYQEVAA